MKIRLGHDSCPASAVVGATYIEIESEGEIQYLTEGNARNPFSVYGRAGAPCYRCGAEIAKSTIGGRSTFFCRGCQA